MLDHRILALLSKSHKKDDITNTSILKLPLERLRGIGVQYATRLNSCGLKTIEDLLKKEVPEGLVPKKLLSKWRIAARIIQQIAQHHGCIFCTST